MSIRVPIASSRYSLKCPRRRRGQRAYTLVEMTVVLVIMSVLVSMALPRFSRSLESARADIAGANLRAIWTAQRIYWLENRTYTANLHDLVGENLIDPSILTDTFYNYAVTGANMSTFTVTAERAPGASWSGTLTITPDGAITGTLVCSGQSSISVGFQ